MAHPRGLNRLNAARSQKDSPVVPPRGDSPALDRLQDRTSGYFALWRDFTGLEHRSGLRDDFLV